MNIEPAPDEITCARQFLAATVPLVTIELANRVPAKGCHKDDSNQQSAQIGAMFQTWSIRVAERLARHLVRLGVTELCRDQEGLAACRVLVPFERIRDHICAIDQRSVLANFQAYCEDIYHYVWEFFAYEQVSSGAPIKESYEIDLITEFYLLAGCDAYSEWAAHLASRVDGSFAEDNTSYVSPYRIEAAGC